MARPESNRAIMRLGSAGLAACLFLLTAAASSGPPIERESEAINAPFALVYDEKRDALCILDAASQSVMIVDASGEGQVRAFSLPKPPSGLALDPGGSMLYVTCGSAEGSVEVFDLEKGRFISSLPAGRSPCAPLAGPKGGRLYLCNRFADQVSFLDPASGSIIKTIPVAREPIAAALSRNGGRLFVGHLLPEGPADDLFNGSAITVIDTEKAEVEAVIPLEDGAVGLRGICLSTDDRFLYATHILARYPLPTTQLERGWINTNALAVVEVESLALVGTVLLDDVDLGAANPWDAACTASGKYLCVSLSGTHELCVIDRRRLHEKLESGNGGREPAVPLAEDLTFLGGIRERIPLPGLGPRGLTVRGDEVFAAQYFSGDAAAVRLSGEGERRPRSFTLGPQAPLGRVRRGEMLFHDARLCFQQWQSCASCHPDGRADGLNWDLLNDGMGNPKNTKSLLLAHATPPSMAMGVRDRAEVAVRAGIRFIQFAQRPEEDAACIDAYLKSLAPEPGPSSTGVDSAVLERGRRLFETAGCARCHPGPLFTDLQVYDVGTGRGMDEGRAFDTPTLVEVWRTAPYLHDGRSATLEEVLREHNPEDRHGATSSLSKQEIEDLAAYLRSL